MNKNPLVSIITVCYNSEKTIKDTIESVLNQTYTNIEYILVDGDSKDNTVGIIKSYEEKAKEKGILYKWISEPDKGIYDAMNKGIDIARGEWIYFLNSGDFYNDEKVLEKIEFELENSDFSVVIGKVTAMNNDKFIGYFPKSYENFLDIRKVFSSHFCHQAIFCRTKSYIEAGRYDLKYKFFSDFNTIYKIIKSESGYKVINNIISEFDLNGVSSSYKNSVILFKEKERIFKEFGANQVKIIYLLNLIRSYLYFIKMKIKDKYICY